MVDDKSAFEVARSWLSQCLEKHAGCRLNNDSRLPKRVLDVGLGKFDDSLKLYEGQGKIYPYATLSYCWGAEQPGKTTKARLAQYKVSIDIMSLPRTIRDSVRAVRELGLRYLWIGM